MGEYKDKVVTAMVLIVCIGIFYARASSGSLSMSGAEAMLTRAESQQMFEQLGGAVGAKPVTMFVTSWCPVCRSLEEELQAMGIGYITVDVEKNLEAARYYAKILQGKTNAVPVTIVGPDVVLGANAKAISRSYALL